jgi:hypothetical protein
MTEWMPAIDIKIKLTSGLTQERSVRIKRKKLFSKTGFKGIDQ